MEVLVLALVLQIPEPMPAKAPEKATPYNLVRAASELHAPRETPIQLNWELSEAIHEVAVKMQIMDERETRYIAVPTHTEEIQSKDLDILRIRREKLEDAPKLEEVYRYDWISRDEINQAISFNRKYKEHLETRLAWEPDRAVVIGRAISENDQLYRVWDALRDAKCDFYYVTVRREGLLRLRDIIGDEAFYRGEMPPHVPVWRFNDAPHR